MRIQFAVGKRLPITWSESESPDGPAILERARLAGSPQGVLGGYVYLRDLQDVGLKTLNQADIAG